MFRGQYRYGVDAKGRLAIPAKFREILSAKFDERLIITHFDGALWAYPVGLWQDLENKITKLPQFLEEVKALQRVFISAAHECALDKQGRILLPASLKERAGLEGEAVLVGMTQRIEIWAKEKWDRVYEESEKQLVGMQEKLAELGI